jgi:hypothetical protein
MRGKEETGARILPVIGCALEQHGEPAGCVRAVDICHEHHAIPHPHSHAGVNGYTEFLCDARICANGCRMAAEHCDKDKDMER